MTSAAQVMKHLGSHAPVQQPISQRDRRRAGWALVPALFAVFMAGMFPAEAATGPPLLIASVILTWPWLRCGLAWFASGGISKANPTLWPWAITTVTLVVVAAMGWKMPAAFFRLQF
ncbi:MAG: hypothetical protein AAF333_03600 [Planctomycetota bacterium]